MNRRDLLSTASAAGALVLTAQSGAQPASAGILGLLSAGIVFKACIGSAFNANLGSSAKAHFKCDLVCEKNENNFKCFNGKLLIYVTITNGVIRYLEGGVSKTVKCLEQKVWIPCDFDIVTHVLQIIKFGCKDEKGRSWTCYPRPFDCDNSSGSPGVLALITQLVLIFKRLQKNPSDPCTDLIHQIFQKVVVLLVVILCS